MKKLIFLIIFIFTCLLENAFSLKILINKNEVRNLDNLVSFYEKEYHCNVYGITIKDNKIIAISRKNINNKKFPANFFLTPVEYAYKNTKSKFLKSIIDKYRNKKINFFTVADLFNTVYFNLSENSDDKIDIDGYLNKMGFRVLVNKYYRLEILDNYLNNGGNTLILIENYMNKKFGNIVISPVRFTHKYYGNKEKCPPNVASSYIDILSFYPTISGVDFRINNYFNLKFSPDTSYLIDYGISYISNKLISIDVVEYMLGCDSSNIDAIYKTYNINIKNERLLKLRDFFSKKYINQKLLPEVFKVLKSKYACDLTQKEISLNKFTIDKNYIYFYFNMGEVTSNNFGNFVLKISYEKEELRKNLL